MGELTRQIEEQIRDGKMFVCDCGETVPLLMPGKNGKKICAKCGTPDEINRYLFESGLKPKPKA